MSETDDDKEAIASEESNRDFIKNVALEEGMEWSLAVKDFDELRVVLDRMTPEERVGRLHSVLQEWKRKPAGQVVADNQPNFLQRLFGFQKPVDSANNMTLDTEAFVFFLENPTIENTVDVLKLYPFSKPKSEALARFTGRMSNVFFDQVIKNVD